MSLSLHIVNSDDQKDYTNLSQITIPATHGELGLLPGHVDMVTPLQEGYITRQENKSYENIEAFKDHTQKLYITGGIAHLSNDSLTIISQ